MSRCVNWRDIFMSTSDLASFIAHHQYKSQKEALQTIWKKNYPMKYAHILNMCNVKVDRVGYCKRLVKNIFNDPTDVPMNDILSQYYIYHDNPGYSMLLQQKILAMIDQRIDPSYDSSTHQLIFSMAIDSLKCQIGIREEDNGIRRYENVIQRTLTCKNTSTSNMFVYLKNNVRVKIYGRIDAYDQKHNAIIEHKQRQSRFLYQIPVHERIQLYVYMNVQQCKKAILIQSYRGETRVLDTIHWNDQEWKYYITQLQHYMDIFMMITERANHEEQCKYIKKHYLYPTNTPTTDTYTHTYTNTNVLL